METGTAPGSPCCRVLKHATVVPSKIAVLENPEAVSAMDDITIPSQNSHQIPPPESRVMTEPQAAAGAGSRWQQVKGALTAQEWRRVAGLGAVILGLHVAGFFVLLALVVPRHFQGGFGLGVGITAYTLGLRHAFDADHIAAIDNTTRKLMTEGKRPLGVGFFFALGHSTVVLGLAFLLAIGVRSISGAVEDDDSELHRITGLVGTSVSASFLYLIAAINLVTFVALVRVFRRMRKGGLDEQQLEDLLTNRGVANRCYARATRTVTRSWHMYPLGVLFGFGFDTATEVTLLVLAADAGIAGLPWYAILCLPLLFAAGMTLLDTLDGVFMNFAYGWALSKPVRKLFYNIVITALSVAVAFLVGTAELLSILGDKLSLQGGFWRWVANIDLNIVGFSIVGLFVVTWLLALAIWRFGRIEERWSSQIVRSEVWQPLNPSADPLTPPRSPSMRV